MHESLSNYEYYESTSWGVSQPSSSADCSDIDTRLIVRRAHRDFRFQAGLWIPVILVRPGRQQDALQFAGSHVAL